MKKNFWCHFFVSALCALPISLTGAMPTPEEALSRLLEGNSHFVNNTNVHVSYLTEAKDTLLEKQTPFAAIVGCSDSRVPPELIFDTGLGDLFVIRDAGNVIGPIEMDSAEFAANSLKVPVIVVMGHQNCGAIKATLVGRNNVPELENIFPLIDTALKKCKSHDKDLLVNAIKCNVRGGVETLKKSPTIAPLLKQGKVKVVGAYYEISTGKVTLIED